MSTDGCYFILNTCMMLKDSYIDSFSNQDKKGVQRSEVCHCGRPTVDQRTSKIVYDKLREKKRSVTQPIVYVF